MRSDRPSGPISRIVGVYQWCSGAPSSISFPTRSLDVAGDRSIIDWDGSADETYFRLHDDPDGLGVEIEWLGTRLMFQPGNPSPLSVDRAPHGRGDRRGDRPSIPRALEPGTLAPLRSISVPDRRSDRRRLSRLGQPLSNSRRPRGPAGRRALHLREPTGLDRGALLGTEADPAAPAYKNVEGAPSFNARLTAIKGFHRLCDGVRTLFLVDRQGDLVRLIDVARWAETTQGSEPLVHPCPRPYLEPRQGHSLRRTCLPGSFALARDQGLRRRDLDVQLQRRPLAAARYPQQVRGLVRRRGPIWLARTGAGDLPGRFEPLRVSPGALFVVLRDPEHSVPQLIAPPIRSPPRSSLTTRKIPRISLPSMPSVPFITSYAE